MVKHFYINYRVNNIVKDIYINIIVFDYNANYY